MDDSNRKFRFKSAWVRAAPCCPAHTFAKRRARIEIVPLIDIIFFLLATFVMVSLSMIKNQGVPVHLPTASTAAPQDRKLSTTVSITDQGTIFLEKRPVTLEELAPELQRLKNDGQEIQVFINGDEKTYFGNAIKVLDEIRRAGIVKVSIQTAPPAQTAEKGT